MAKLYILSEKDIQNGTRPKTPRQKQRDWRRAFFVLTFLVIAEHIIYFYWFK